MGYYIQGPQFGKAQYLCKELGAKQVSKEKAREIVAEGKKAVIVVVENPAFDAAAFAYDEREFSSFVDYPEDVRPKTILEMDLDKAKKLSNYNRE
jgi:hypothetical protein